MLKCLTDFVRKRVPEAQVAGCKMFGLLFRSGIPFRPFFLQNSNAILMNKCSNPRPSQRSKKHTKKRHYLKCFFEVGQPKSCHLENSWFWPAHFRNSWFGLAHFRISRFGLAPSGIFDLVLAHSIFFLVNVLFLVFHPHVSVFSF